MATISSPSGSSNRSQEVIKSQEASSPSHFLGLPEDLLAGIFHDHLNLKELERMALTCKGIRKFMDDPKMGWVWKVSQLSSSIYLIDEDAWKENVDLEEYQIDVTGALPLDRRALVKKLNPLSRELGANSRIIVFLNPKGYSVNKGFQIAAAGKNGNIVHISPYFSPEVLAVLEGQEVEETKWRFITSPLPGTDRHMNDQHSDDVQRAAERCKLQLEMIGVRDLTVGFIFTNMIALLRDASPQIIAKESWISLAPIQINEISTPLVGSFTDLGLKVVKDTSAVNPGPGDYVGTSGSV